ncbi:MAG: TonB-dependent receptor [Chitinophagaceae bacterium BSSC1]|nr:MAG: TonB-dependent receptor [Chitinophagaceae bacterium BSSC1]
MKQISTVLKKGRSPFCFPLLLCLVAVFLVASSLRAQTSLQTIPKDSTKPKSTKDSVSKEKVTVLQEVVVKSKKPFVEIQTDKTVLNVQSNLVASSGTVFEVLQSAPGVSITNEETINMSGKAGVNVLIDGRPTQLSAKDLANWLKSMPASQVDKVELISNPSAKYDAQGNAGIINIKLKKNTQKGFNGSATGAYVQAVHPNTNFSTDFNLRAGKWNFFANAAARKLRQNTDGAIDRKVNSNGKVKDFINRTVDIDSSSNLNLNLGADYYVNKQSSFGLLIKNNEYRSSLITPGTTLIQTNGITDSSLQTLNDIQQKNSRTNYNTNYHYEDSLGREWNIDADYTNYRNSNNSLIKTNLLNAQQIKYGNTANQQSVATAIEIYSLKADYSKNFKASNAKLEAGLKWNRIMTNNDLQAAILESGIMKADTGRTNQFDYTENISAAYVSYNKRMGKWEAQMGLRAEYAQIKGQSTDLKGKQINYPDTSYLNLFPTAFLRYVPNDKHSIGLNFGRRINRPSYQDLNPFEFVFDNYTRSKGNPYLLPELSSQIELNYSYKGALNLGFGYSHTQNSFQNISTQKAEVTEATTYNIGTEKRFFLNFSLYLPITKWWDSYTNLSPNYKRYQGQVPEGAIDQAAWGMNWYGSNSFSLPKQWKIQVSSWGNIATKDAMSSTAWLGSVDMGVGKSWKDKPWSFRVSVTDIFNTQRWKQEVDFGNVHYQYLRKWESRNLRLQVTYKFGKSKFSKRDRELGSVSEEDRIK